MRKRAGIILITAVFSMLLLASCGKGEAKKEEAKRLLEEKYGRKFTVTSYDGQQIMETYYSVSAYAENDPQLPFKAYVDEDGSSVSDDYVARKVCNNISARVNENLSGLPCPYYVNTGIMSGESMCSDPEVSIEEFASVWEPDNRYYIYVYLSDRILKNNTDAGQICMTMEQALSGLPGIKGNLTICISDEKTIEKVRKYTETNTRLYDDYFKLTENDQQKQFDFENNVLNITESDINAMLDN